MNFTRVCLSPHGSLSFGKPSQGHSKAFVSWSIHKSSGASTNRPWQHCGFPAASLRSVCLHFCLRLQCKQSCVVKRKQTDRDPIALMMRPLIAIIIDDRVFWSVHKLLLAFFVYIYGSGENVNKTTIIQYLHLPRISIHLCLYHFWWWFFYSMPRLISFQNKKHCITHHPKEILIYY